MGPPYTNLTCLMLIAMSISGDVQGRQSVTIEVLGDIVRTRNEEPELLQLSEMPTVTTYELLEDESNSVILRVGSEVE